MASHAEPVQWDPNLEVVPMSAKTWTKLEPDVSKAVMQS